MTSEALLRSKSLGELGRALTPSMLQGTMALFARQALGPDPSFCTVERDVAYGSADRHRLDIFRPVAAAAALLPVVIFVHGGGFIGGDKGGPRSPFYNNVGAWAAQHGWIGVTMTYRLAPAAVFPAGSDDVAEAVAWLRGRAHEYGANPDAIVVMGQSAGAAHVAHYIAQPGYSSATSVAAAVLMSGIYDLTRLVHGPMEQAYFGSDADRFEEQSSLAGLLTTPVPCLFLVAEYDPIEFQQQAGHVVAAHLTVKGAWPRMLYLPGHNHLSPALTLGGPADDVGPQIANFVSGHVTPTGDLRSRTLPRRRCD